jgi:hypothetical protein
MSVKIGRFSSNRGVPKRQKHGFYAAKKELLNRGARPIDKRTAVGHSLEEWKSNLIADLGGSEALSSQQLMIVDIASRTLVLLHITDKWILSQGEAGIINRRNKSLYPIIAQRQALANSLAGYMSQLGLEKRQRPILALSEYLAEREAANSEKPHGARQQKREAGSGKFAKKAADIETGAESVDEDGGEK